MATLVTCIAALSLTVAAAAPVPAREGQTISPPAKAKKKLSRHMAKADTATVSRAAPVAAPHSNFFATPLGLLTVAGAGGGAVAGTAAALSAQGNASSPQ